MGRQERYDRRKAATEQAAAEDAAAKKALAAKIQKGKAGRLSRRELRLARRMEEGEGT